MATETEAGGLMTARQVVVAVGLAPPRRRKLVRARADWLDGLAGEGKIPSLAVPAADGRTERLYHAPAVRHALEMLASWGVAFAGGNKEPRLSQQGGGVDLARADHDVGGSDPTEPAGVCQG